MAVRGGAGARFGLGEHGQCAGHVAGLPAQRAQVEQGPRGQVVQVRRPGDRRGAVQVGGRVRLVVQAQDDAERPLGAGDDRAGEVRCDEPPRRRVLQRAAGQRLRLGELGELDVGPCLYRVEPGQQQRLTRSDGAGRVGAQRERLGGVVALQPAFGQPQQDEGAYRRGLFVGERLPVGGVRLVPPDGVDQQVAAHHQ